jgi:anthranilate phosphoribosyltransferase
VAGEATALGAGAAAAAKAMDDGAAAETLAAMREATPSA